jgi:hypothetical protein
MTTIWKYPLKAVERQVVEMPKGATILSVQTQHGDVCIWALVDPEAKKESRTIWIVGTGHEMPEGIHLRYLGTTQTPGGTFVPHVFEEIVAEQRKVGG